MAEFRITIKINGSTEAISVKSYMVLMINTIETVPSMK